MSFKKPDNRWFPSLSGNTHIFLHFSICGQHVLAVIHVALLVKEVMEVQIFQKMCVWEFMFLLLQMCVWERVLLCYHHLSPALFEWLGLCVSGRAPGEDSSASSGLHQSFDTGKEQQQAPESPTSSLQLRTSPTLCVRRCECMCVWRTWAKGTCLTSLDEHLVPLLGICSCISFHLTLGIAY